MSSDIINAGKETVTLLPGASIFGDLQSEDDARCYSLTYGTQIPVNRFP